MAEGGMRHARSLNDIPSGPGSENTMSSTYYSASALDVRPIHVFLNGDRFYAAKKYVFNKKYEPSLRYFYQHLTELLRPPQGI